jgi:hypothetical protein
MPSSQRYSWNNDNATSARHDSIRWRAGKATDQLRGATGSSHRNDSKGRNQGFWWTTGAVVAVYAAAAVAFFASNVWFIDNAHCIAGEGLFICVCLAAAANAGRGQ